MLLWFVISQFTHILYDYLIGLGIMIHLQQYQLLHLEEYEYIHGIGNIATQTSDILNSIVG